MASLTGYIETRLELAKVEVKEEVASGLAKSVLFVAITSLASIFLLFLSVAIAVLIGSRLSMWLGFLIVGGFYLIVGVLLWAFRKPIQSKLEVYFRRSFKLIK